MLKPLKTKQNSTNYLVIGTAERGYSIPILKVLANFAAHTKANVVYSGALSDRFAIAMYDSKTRKAKTLGGERDRDAKTLKKINATIREIVDKQDKTIIDLCTHLGPVKFVVNDSLYINDGLAADLSPVSHLDLSKYLTITPVAPNGDRVSGNPLTPRSIQMYRYYNNSVVCPHPVMATRLFAREGINQALQFITTGALRWPTNAKRQSATFEHFSHPGAVLITLDNDTGQFYHQRIHVDRNSSDILFIAWDGLIITANDMKEAPPADRLSFATDTHGQYKNKAAWYAFLESIQLHAPATVVHGGDLADMPSLNGHSPKHTLVHDGLRLSNDLEVFCDDVVEMHNAATEEAKIVILESNHHEWLNRYINDNKVLHGLIGWPQMQSKLIDYTGNEGITIREDAPGQESFLWGDFRLRHGHTDGSVISLSDTQGKAINGHYHTHEEYMDAIRLGCTCVHMPYMKGANDRWILQIATGTKYHGIARLHAKTILEKNGIISFAYQGKIRRYVFA